MLVLPPSPGRSKIKTASQGSFLGASRFGGGSCRRGPLAGQGDEGTVQRPGLLGRLQPLRLPPVLAGPQDAGHLALQPLGALLLPHVVLGILGVRGLLEALLQGDGITTSASPQACPPSGWGCTSLSFIHPMETLSHPWKHSRSGWAGL